MPGDEWLSVDNATAIPAAYRGAQTQQPAVTSSMAVSSLGLGNERGRSVLEQQLAAHYTHNLCAQHVTVHSLYTILSLSSLA